MGYVTKEEVECKRCGRTIHKKELQYDSSEGRICLECYVRSHIYKVKSPHYTLERAPPEESPEKNPLIAAILNFLLPGLGFIYLRTPIFIAGGTILLIISLITIAVYWPLLLFWYVIICAPFFAPLYFLLYFLPYLILFPPIFWPVLGYFAAKHVNMCARERSCACAERDEK